MGCVTWQPILVLFPFLCWRWWKAAKFRMKTHLDGEGFWRNTLQAWRKHGDNTAQGTYSALHSRFTRFFTMHKLAQSHFQKLNVRPGNLSCSHRTQSHQTRKKYRIYRAWAFKSNSNYLSFWGNNNSNNNSNNQISIAPYASYRGATGIRGLMRGMVNLPKVTMIY